MNRTINQLDELTTIANGDEIPVWDNTAQKTKKASKQNFLKEIINSLLTKADKVSSATAGNLASLDSNGNLEDSGINKNKVIEQDHNVPRLIPKDITSYMSDGTFYKRLNGTDGFSLFEDIFAGDYFQMSRAITCPDSTSSTVGTQWITIAGLDTLWGNGTTIDNISTVVNYHHAVCVGGKGFDTSVANHFGRHRMHAAMGSLTIGYNGTEMHNSVLGDIVTSGNGSTASGATINQQLRAEFKDHLKVVPALLSNAKDNTRYNRFGQNTGASSGWVWARVQAVLMSEVEVYGSIVWSSSGYDIGEAKLQLPVFRDCRFLNNRSSYYWLRAIAASSIFCYVDGIGIAYYLGADTTGGYVRPRFVIAA